MPAPPRDYDRLTTAETKRIKAKIVGPQPGPQTDLVTCPADVAVYGGAAGAGKTVGLLLDIVRNTDVPNFSAVCFRREYPELMAPGGLCDEAYNIFPHAGGKARDNGIEWFFPSGAKVKFSHLSRPKDHLKWKGAQVPLFIFDQLETFAWEQFWYLFSRNRSTCSVIPYVRASCNPDPDHWLREFMRWWIDDDTGLPIIERSGIIRWFVRRGDEIDWDHDPEALIDRHGPDERPKSFTFIAGTIQDNPILLQANPEYMANLRALDYVERMRLLYGNWNVRATAGEVFKKAWFEIVPAAPAGIRTVRYWDRAATPAEAANAKQASWTAGGKMGKSNDGYYYIMDMVRFQGSPKTVEDQIYNTATQDGTAVEIGIEQDPGQAGKAEAQYQVRRLAGYKVRINIPRENKGVRAKPLSAQAEAGNVRIVRGQWNKALLDELENFDGTDACVSDQTDSLSGAFTILTEKKKRAGALRPHHS